MWLLRSMHERISFNVYRHLENILAVLNEYGVSATFFINGTMAEKHPRIPQRICKFEHEIASLGHSHRSFSEVSFGEAENEISKSIAVLSKYQEVRGFRAPSLLRNKATFLACEKLGLSFDSSEHGLTKYCPNGFKVTVLPVVSPVDTHGLDIMRLQSKDLVLKWLSEFSRSNGATVCMHVWRMGRRKYVKTLLEPLLKNGLSFVRACELLHDEGVALTFDVEYANVSETSPVSVLPLESHRRKRAEAFEARDFPT